MAAAPRPLRCSWRLGEHERELGGIRTVWAGCSAVSLLVNVIHAGNLDHGFSGQPARRNRSKAGQFAARVRTADESFTLGVGNEFISG